MDGLAPPDTSAKPRRRRRRVDRWDGRYVAWRLAVLRRDEWECVACGSTLRLCAHHLKDWARYPEFRYDVANGRSLCQECHAAVHWRITEQRVASGAGLPRGDQHWTRRMPWLIKAIVARGDRHGSHTKPERRTYGERNGSARLTDEVVLQLRQRYPQESFRALATAFGLPYGLVCRVIRGERWPHLAGAQAWDHTYYNNVLTAEQVRAILRRLDSGERQKDIALDLGVSISVISAIVCGKTWRHVSGLASTRRGHQGERNASAKLTADGVRHIRALAAQGFSQGKIAALMGVTQTNVSQILRGKTWSHVA